MAKGRNARKMPDHPVLGPTAKAHVAKLREMGVEDPRKFFIQGKEEVGTWKNIKQEAKSDIRTSGSASWDKAINDPSLVGSRSEYTNFGGTASDGQPFVGGAGNEMSGGGGGTGSSTAGRESAGMVGMMEGQSMEEIVYGVQKRRKNAGMRKSRGQGE